MIFIEPTVAFASRTRPPTLPPMSDAMTAKEIMAISMSGQAEQPSTEDDLRDLILEILNFEGEIPVRITDVVNRVAAWTPNLSRRERERAKLSAFRMLGRMMRRKELRRVSRNYVLIEPEQDRHHDPAIRLPPVELPEPRV
jgi:hypothetical protein